MCLFGSKKNKKLETIYLGFHENRGNISNIKSIKTKGAFLVSYKTLNYRSCESNLKPWAYIYVSFSKNRGNKLIFLNKKRRSRYIHPRFYIVHGERFVIKSIICCSGHMIHSNYLLFDMFSNKVVMNVNVFCIIMLNWIFWNIDDTHVIIV